MCKSSDDYVSNREWLRDAVGGKNLILCNVSALEYLQLFGGYFGEKNIDVYATKKGDNENINYCLIDNFSEVDFTQNNGVLCCSIQQIVNDMLADFYNTDEQALTEALANYYYSHNNSFDGIIIKGEHMQRFESLKMSASKYYSEG